MHLWNIRTKLKSNQYDWTYHVKDKTFCEKSFNGFGDAISLSEKISNGDTMIEKVKTD